MDGKQMSRFFRYSENVKSTHLQRRGHSRCLEGDTDYKLYFITSANQEARFRYTTRG
jgi:hypothetical protein